MLMYHGIQNHPIDWASFWTMCCWHLHGFGGKIYTLKNKMGKIEVGGWWKTVRPVMGTLYILGARQNLIISFCLVMGPIDCCVHFLREVSVFSQGVSFLLGEECVDFWLHRWLLFSSRVVHPYSEEIKDRRFAGIHSCWLWWQVC